MFISGLRGDQKRKRERERSVQFSIIIGAGRDAAAENKL
jgi:hypothetical protein